MGAAEAVAIFAAGGAAGTINAVVGSGTLITFPVLLAFGYTPVTANVSNSIGIVAGSVSGAHGYRAELRGQGRRALALAVPSLAGGIAGALLLLALPEAAFKAIVPGFIAAALVLIVLQPWLVRRLSGRHGLPLGGRGALHAGVLAVGVYGGYFGAAQGIMLLALLGLALPDSLQALNGLKNILAALTNLVSGLVFVAAAEHVSWPAAGLIAAGSALGGVLGARVGRRLPLPVLRGVIVAVGTAAILKLVL
ncbi:MAG TPA: sulfite exporter TauE/SafE family protein [Gaiellaceae bacterium]|nr:sulfite exporter TauE/SafE family protein [Gaiellaceae bacterium]